MDQAKFEALLDGVAGQLALEAQGKPFPNSGDFEQRTRELLLERGGGQMTVDFDPHPRLSGYLPWPVWRRSEIHCKGHLAQRRQQRF